MTKRRLVILTIGLASGLFVTNSISAQPGSSPPVVFRSESGNFSATQPSINDLLSVPPGASSKAEYEFIPQEARRAAAEGNAAFAKGNFQRAVRAYQQVLSLAPNNLVGLVNLGVAQYRIGDTASAEKNLKQAISLRLETGVAWLMLGTLYMDQNRLDEGLGALTQARIYDPKNARIHNYLGVLLSRMGWSDAAESELRTAVELDTSYSDAHYNLVVIYMGRNPPSVELAKRHYYLAVQNGALRDTKMEKELKNSTIASDGRTFINK